MPFELTAHDPYTDRLPDNRIKIWNAGEDVTDPADVARLFGNPWFVKRWVDEPAPEPAPKVESAPNVLSAPAVNPAPAPSDPAPEPKPAS